MSKYEVRPCENQKNENLEWWVYGEGNSFGPFLTEGRAQEFATELNKKGIVTGKSCIGKILTIEGGLIIQDIGRGVTVLHDVSKLSKPIRVGNSENIVYKNGIGVVKEKKELWIGIER